MEGQSPHASIVVGVDLCTEVEERRRQENAVLDNANDAILLPNEDAPVGCESQADQLKRREICDDLGLKAGIGKGLPRCGPGKRGEQREGAHHDTGQDSQSWAEVTVHEWQPSDARRITACDMWTSGKK